MTLEEAIEIVKKSRTYDGWMSFGLMRYELVPLANKIVAHHFVNSLPSLPPHDQ